MRIDVAQLPSQLTPELLRDRTVVVFDVLRATTTMLTAIHSGANEIRVFQTLDDARAAAHEFVGAKLLCGEHRTRRPPDFDLGNSPGDFTASRVAGKTIFMSTTNGTRAIVAAQSARQILPAALINAKATADFLRNNPSDVTLLCSGTDGEPSIEDQIGAGAVISHLNSCTLSEFAEFCHQQFMDAEDDLATVLRNGQGGKNIIAAGLEPDIDFAARIDSVSTVAVVERDPLRVMRHG